MKKAWDDIKSFVTVVMTIAFIAFTAMKYISGEQFYSLFQIVIAFYFGTQFEKKRKMEGDEKMSASNLEEIEVTGATEGEVKEPEEVVEEVAEEKVEGGEE